MEEEGAGRSLTLWEYMEDSSLAFPGPLMSMQVPELRGKTQGPRVDALQATSDTCRGAAQLAPLPPALAFCSQPSSQSQTQVGSGPSSSQNPPAAPTSPRETAKDWGGGMHSSSTRNCPERATTKCASAGRGVSTHHTIHHTTEHQSLLTWGHTCNTHSNMVGSQIHYTEQTKPDTKTADCMLPCAQGSRTSHTVWY